MSYVHTGHVKVRMPKDKLKFIPHRQLTIIDQPNRLSTDLFLINKWMKHSHKYLVLRILSIVFWSSLLQIQTIQGCSLIPSVTNPMFWKMHLFFPLFLFFLHQRMNVSVINRIPGLSESLTPCSEMLKRNAIHLCHRVRASDLINL